MDSRKRKILSDDKNMPTDLYKEWDEASCPICMEHPHNAVLLICSSHKNGCRSYICDTSYRHSNCLDRFKKLKEENLDTTSSPPNLNPGSPHVSIDSPSLETNNNNTEKSVGGLNLKCPLCRGTVSSFKVIEEARKYLNSKLRSCSRESCSFSGNYRELRGHARRVHPTVCPADIDPSRERAWRRLENQREYNDIVSAVPGSVVVGDYVIERGGDGATRDEDSGPDQGGQSLTTYVLLHMLRSIEGRGDWTRTRTGTGTRTRNIMTRSRGTVPHPPYSFFGGSTSGGGGGTTRRRRYLWGENLLGLQDDSDEDEDEDEDEDDEDEDEDEEDDDDDADADDNEDDDDEVDMNMLSDIGLPRRRLRRRITRARSGNEDRQ